MLQKHIDLYRANKLANVLSILISLIHDIHKLKKNENPCPSLSRDRLTLQVVWSLCKYTNMVSASIRNVELQKLTEMKYF